MGGESGRTNTQSNGKAQERCGASSRGNERQLDKGGCTKKRKKNSKGGQRFKNFRRPKTEKKGEGLGEAKDNRKDQKTGKVMMGGPKREERKTTRGEETRIFSGKNPFK